MRARLEDKTVEEPIILQKFFSRNFPPPIAACIVVHHIKLVPIIADRMIGRPINDGIIKGERGGEGGGGECQVRRQVQTVDF